MTTEGSLNGPPQTRQKRALSGQARVKCDQSDGAKVESCLGEFLQIKENKIEIMRKQRPRAQLTNGFLG